MRIVLSVLVAVLAATTLTACDPPAHDPIAIRMDGGALVVAICESISATTILMESRGPATKDGEWEIFYSWKGSQEIAAGDTFRTENADDVEERGVRNTPALIHKTSLSILFSDQVEPFQSVSTHYEIGEEGVPDDGWLQWDGEVTEQPCGH